uniref:Uncharacterized protein n=1 Tax=Timema genevievae TaxID=629358 RepID=A0A7R9K6N1_TIMGE|nr:unnamed protein product [Timema genevievae]
MATCLSTAYTSKNSLVHMHKHWDNVKSRRKRELVEETLELMNNGKRPYKSHKPSCPKVEVVAPHFNYHLGYEWDGDAVAAAKRHQTFNSDMTAALRFLNYKQYQSVAAISYTSASSLSQPFHLTCITNIPLFPPP